MEGDRRMAYEDEVELRAVVARWDALREEWALTASEEAGLLGGARLHGPVGKVESWAAEGMERRMRMLIGLDVAIRPVLLTEVRIRSWLRRELAVLDDMRPLDAMASSPEWIRAFRDAAAVFAS